MAFLSVVRAMLSRLSGWPRRVAVLVCLLLAVTSFVHRHTAAAGAQQHGLTSGLGPDQVAIAVQVGAEVSTLVHTGDRVDLVAAAGDPATGDTTAAPTAAALARGVRVLAVLPPAEQFGGGDPTAWLVVATDRGTATALAAARGRQITALLSG